VRFSWCEYEDYGLLGRQELHRFRRRQVLRKPTYLPTYLPNYLPTYLPTYLITYLPNYLPTHLPNYLPTHLHTYLLPTYLASQPRKP